MADEQDSCHGFLRFVCLRSLYHTGGRISPHFFSDARNGNRELLARRANLCCACRKEKFRMDVKDILHDLRVEKGLSQSELAEKVFVSRQAVSRWENGETTPNPETLKRLSGIFDVSINTLLGSPRQLVCQCCGMPLEDATTSHTTSYHFRRG